MRTDIPVNTFSVPKSADLGIFQSTSPRKYFFRTFFERFRYSPEHFSPRIFFPYFFRAIQVLFEYGEDLCYGKQSSQRSYYYRNRSVSCTVQHARSYVNHSRIGYEYYPLTQQYRIDNIRHTRADQAKAEQLTFASISGYLSVPNYLPVPEFADCICQYLKNT